MTTPANDDWSPEAVGERARARASVALAAWLGYQGPEPPRPGDVRDAITDLINDLGFLWEAIPDDEKWEPTYRELVNTACSAYEEQSAGIW